MIKKVKKEIIDFANMIDNVGKSNEDISLFLDDIKKKIIEKTKMYINSDNYQLQESLRNELVNCYNLLYFYQAKVNGLRKAYMLDKEIESLPNIYMVEQLPEKFEVDERLIAEINISNGLTEEQALELLKWTVNNTRNNLIIEEMGRTGIPGDVYGNSCLDGACGLSQFSTLYPLQQLGLEITINNVGDICGIRHAYGTVVIPININGKITKKRFLIDCTYRQFFTLPFNVVSRYLGNPPSVGFFTSLNQEQIDFSKELLKNGFVEASLENMNKYLKPFFYSSVSADNIHEMDKKFGEVDIFDILENKQEEFDYTEEEFFEWGMNLNFITQKSKKI